MKLFVNGEEADIEASTLSALLEELDFHGDWLATAVNSELVAAEDRDGFALQDGQRVEILSPMQGG